MYTRELYQTLIDILALPSTSGHEEHVRAYLEQRLSSSGLTTSIDSSGNLIATLPGDGTPLLLNAHMDRVPPGKGHQPVLRDGILYGDGTTNLGADDAAGIAIILETVTRLLEQHLPHPPLVLVFTVQEEVGLCGASGFDSTSWQVHHGIVFDNAFEAGVVVSQGASYESFDIKIIGRTGHPGKDLAHTVDALEIFRQADYPRGSLAHDQTRINIGRITAGSARNMIPDIVMLEGELRSFEPAEARQRYHQAIRAAFEQAAKRLGGRVEITTVSKPGYLVDENEPLLDTYRTVLKQRGAVLSMRPTFIGSDTSGFRPSIQAFTTSTGVANEHSMDESVALAPLEQLVQDTIQLLRSWCERQ